MKKSPLLFNILGTILIIIFIIHTFINYLNYDESYSSPFYIWVVANSIYYIIPSIISFIIGHILRKKIQ